MYKLVILRHGESIWNLENKFTGWTDVNLTKKGINEAKNAGKLLKLKGFTFDIAFTSLLSRANDTLKYCLSEMNLNNIVIQKSWRLNERHYGSLQGLNKEEMAIKHGEEQVLIWRRSYDIAPPLLPTKDKTHPSNNKKYFHIENSLIPSSESLKDVVNRFMPLWKNVILKKIKSGNRILIVAHGNSLRALVKKLNKIDKYDIVKYNIPTGSPMVFEFNNNFKIINNYYLGNQKSINEKIKLVENQGTLGN